MLSFIWIKKKTRPFFTGSLFKCYIENKNATTTTRGSSRGPAIFLYFLHSPPKADSQLYFWLSLRRYCPSKAAFLAGLETLLCFSSKLSLRFNADSGSFGFVISPISNGISFWIGRYHSCFELTYNFAPLIFPSLPLITSSTLPIGQRLRGVGDSLLICTTSPTFKLGSPAFSLT